MNLKKSFDRFFLFALALLAALYFFGAKRYPANSLEKADAQCSPSVQPSLFPENDHSLPPFDEQTKEEPVREDDKPTDPGKTSQVGECMTGKPGILVMMHSGEENSSAKNKYHCPMHIRIRAILV